VIVTTSVIDNRSSAPPATAGLDAETARRSPGYSRVLVPMDGSERSAGAVPAAWTLSRAFGAEVSYLTVASSPLELEVAVDDCTRWVPPARLCTRLSDDVAGAIVRAGRRDRRAPLRCMASRGRGRLGGYVLGSVTEDVVRRSDEPVVVAGPRFDATAFARIKRLLMCVDGSTEFEAILPSAVAWVRDLGVDLEIVTVLPETFHLADPDISEAAGVKRLADRFTDRDLRPQWEVLHDDDPAAAIVRYAAQVPGTLVAMQTHGRRGAARLRFGSVAMRVVHYSTSPVLLIGPVQTDTTVPEAEAATLPRRQATVRGVTAPLAPWR
jgi:nucleotide-binding universal stress UspA family protein